MGEIYRNTQKVLVWLGPGDEYSGNVIGIFKQLAAQWDRYGMKPAKNGSILESWAASKPLTADVKEALQKIPIEYDWSGADAFYSLPWFSRMWIVQEIALGPSAHLYCGKFDIPWEDFMLAARIEYRSVQQITAMNLRLPKNFHLTLLLDGGLRFFKANKQNPKLLTLLQNFYCSNCLDARDRVYSLLGLRGVEDVEVKPNYNNPTTTLYVELAQEFLRKDVKSFTKIFYCAGVARTLSRRDRTPLGLQNTVHDISSIPAMDAICQDLPSWVPDWRIIGEYQSFQIARATVSMYSAATGFSTNIKIDETDGYPRVLAQIIDIIKDGKTLGLKPELDYNAHRDQVLLMKQFYDEQTGRLKPKNEEEALMTFARTIIADRTQSNTRTFLRDPLSSIDLKNLWLQYASTPYKDHSATEHFETDGSKGREIGPKMQTLAETSTLKVYSNLFSYRMALKNLLDDRQFIITNDGLAGLAPAISQPGDHIVLPAGAATPLVLRSSGQTNGRGIQYYIIGDCFLHGVMYGELFEAMKVTPWHWITLR